MQAEQGSKKLGLFNIFSLGVGGAIGSGIFVMMGYGIAYTGRSIVLAVSIGCLYMLMAYLFHPIMSSVFVLPGGDYDMKVMLMNPTSYGLAFASYFTAVFPGLAPYQKWIAAALILIFFAVSVKGTKFISNVTSVITVILLVSIVAFLAVGLPKVQPGYFSNDDGMFWANGFGGVIAAIAMMSFACQGTTMAPVSVMPVTKKARRTIPLGILLITLTVGVVYGLMSIVAAGVLPVEQVMGQNLSVVAAAIFSPTVYKVFILGGACCAIISSLASGLTMLRYPLLAVAEDGWLPKVFAKTDKNGYPYVVMGLFLVVSILPLFTSLTVDTIISLVMILSMIMNIYMNIAMIKLPKQYPEQWKNATLRMPIPLFNCLCVIGAVCATAVAYYLFKDLSVSNMILCAVLVVGIFIYVQIRLRMGAVKKEDLAAKREKIAAAAIAATEAED
jgi:APA family basic amino acid/polyamine antiporter